MTGSRFSKESNHLRDELKAKRNAYQSPLIGSAAPLSRAKLTAAVDDAAAPPIAAIEAVHQEVLFNERQIGTWDLVDVNFMARGAAVSRAVGQVHARDDEGPYTGTSFLIAPNLLCTNWHNLPTAEIAEKAFVEFDYELDSNGDPRETHRFKLRPDLAFWSVEKSGGIDFDVCIVGIESQSVGGEPIESFGYLTLNPETGKIEEDDFVTLIHHPGGTLKQVAIRENRLIKKDDFVLWYASDTSPGSSGAPCFSDRWEVVAMHRRGVPQTKEGNPELIALRNGSFLTRAEIQELRISDREILWLANEGLRVSVLIEGLKKDPVSTENELLSSLVRNMGEQYFPDDRVEVVPIAPYNTDLFAENRRPQNDYDRRNGYQPDFLGIEIPPPNLDDAISRWGELAWNSDTGEAEFPYYNFSVWMNKERRLALVAAVNIDGENHNQRNRDEFGDDKWVFDDRLPERYQVGNWFYGNEPARYNKNYFDRGHVIRRTEPSWGPDEAAKLANDDTFHWTNCSPQYKTFNQRSKYWQGLENYLLEDGAIAHGKRLTLFTGPVFSDDDTEHRSILVPKLFFKVAVFVDTEGRLCSAAYVLDQSEWVEAIDFEQDRTLDVKAVRRSISWLEQQTGLDFGDEIRSADQAGGLGDDLTQISELPDLFV